jgi:glycosyltransferase involved in cell wall biosynthesis
MSAPAIILTMIVRDEAHIIRRCIESVRHLVDGVYIHDTGSVDGTETVAKHACQQAGLPVKVEHERWVNFATNRNQCLIGAAIEEAMTYGRPAYALMIDADEVIEYGSAYETERAALTRDLYDIETVLGGTTYWRPQLFRLDRGFRYRGVVHEYLEAPPGTTRSHLHGVINRPIQDSARNRMGDEKYRLDALTLRHALQTEADPFLRARYTFYLANCYRDSGDWQSALTRYMDRSIMGGWPDEVYCSLLYGGRMAERLGHDAQAAEMWGRAASMGLPRVEAHYHAVRWHRTHGAEEFARVLLGQAQRVTVDSGGLFVERWAAETGIPAEAELLREVAA